MKVRFALAPMSAAMWLMTVICFAILPVMYFAAAGAPGPAHTVLLAVVSVIGALYIFIALWMRPTAFFVDADGIEIAWPLRSRRIDAASITRARVCDMPQLKAELGYLMRIGAGGLWGGFGLARTGRGTLELWVSRTDKIVWVECEGRRSLLITPADPDRFVNELPIRR